MEAVTPKLTAENVSIQLLRKTTDTVPASAQVTGIDIKEAETMGYKLKEGASISGNLEKFCRPVFCPMVLRTRNGRRGKHGGYVWRRL